MKQRNRRSFWNIAAGIATEVGFSMGLLASLCLLAYLVSFLVR